jgi:hypothetical protein
VSTRPEGQFATPPFQGSTESDAQPIKSDHFWDRNHEEFERKIGHSEGLISPEMASDCRGFCRAAASVLIGLATDLPSPLVWRGSQLMSYRQPIGFQHICQLLTRCHITTRCSDAFYSRSPSNTLLTASLWVL